MKAKIVACEYCGKAFTARGISRHESKCSQTRCRARKFTLPGCDDNILSVITSFLSNQSLVKMQLVTGARFPGSCSKISAICCPCENDELAISNGLCLACNVAKNLQFKQTVIATKARRLYGIRDIDVIPHKIVNFGGYKYCKLFKHSDLQQHAISCFKTKRAWLEMLAGKVYHRQRVLEAMHQKEAQ